MLFGLLQTASPDRDPQGPRLHLTFLHDSGSRLGYAYIDLWFGLLSKVTVFRTKIGVGNRPRGRHWSRLRGFRADRNFKGCRVPRCLRCSNTLGVARFPPLASLAVFADLQLKISNSLRRGTSLARAEENSVFSAISQSGFLLLDKSLGAVASNREAIRILT